MRIIFAGTPEFARAALERLYASGHHITLVLTQPDRPAGRGMKLQASPVKQFALAHQLPVMQPHSLRLDGADPEDARNAQAAIIAARADAMVVAAYGLLLPQWVLDAPQPWGCLNIHASLLPRWRGAAPIHRALEAGDTQTGITIMQMDAGLDTGDMLLTAPLPITLEDTSGTLHDKLMTLGADLIAQALAHPECLQRTPQPTQAVSYAAKIAKSEAAIDWSQPAAVIERRIRAFNPYPGTTTSLGSETVKVWAAHVLPINRPANTKAGQIVSTSHDGIDICASDFVVRITQLQKPGGKPLTADLFLRGFNLTPPNVKVG